MCALQTPAFKRRTPISFLIVLAALMLKWIWPTHPWEDLMAPFPLAWNVLLSWHLTLCWSPQLWIPVVQLVSSKDTLYYVPLSTSLLSSCQIREITGLISKPTGGGCNYKSKFVTICAAAWTEPGVHTQKQLSSIPPLPFVCVATCHLVSYLITVWAWTVSNEYTAA